MSDACPHCSGLGSVPDPRFAHFIRITCPKCDGSGKMRVVLPLREVNESLNAAYERLQRLKKETT